MTRKRGRPPLPKKYRKISTTIFLPRDLQRDLRKLGKHLDVSVGHLLREGARLLLAKYAKEGSR